MGAEGDIDRTGTLSAGIAAKIGPINPTPEQFARAEAVAAHNRRTLDDYSNLPWDHPVGRVLWIHFDRVQANDYNPNSVAFQEMKLLHTSISSDGYTQPVVSMWDAEIEKYVIVDGFHRYSTMKAYQDIWDASEGYLPVVVIEKSISDRIASTVRHNRARGKHSVAGMSNLVFQMLQEGDSDTVICEKLGLEAEELVRLKYITGYAKLYADVPEYSKVMLTKGQLDVKSKYKKEHPDEPVGSVI